MAERRNVIRRDSRGRFARAAGAKVATKTAARKVRKSAVRKTKQSYVKGSFTRNLFVGESDTGHKGFKVGAELRSPAGRSVVGKAIVGYHGRPDRRVDVTPRLDKPKKALVVTVKPNPGRKKRAAPSSKTTAGTRLKR